MPSPKDFNLTPYYDDYSEDKKFHRILFRPAFAVQARELTQSQTILQNQMERLSDHFFEKGAMVIPGEISYDLEYYAVKISNFSGTSNLANFVGAELTGVISDVKATVINYSVADGTDPDTLFVKYLNSGSSNTSSAFTVNESITATVNIDGVSTEISAEVQETAIGSSAEVAEGIYYINGFHVKVDNQIIILEKYSNTPSYRVGLLVTESFVQSTDDESLLDNAQGSSNVNAPGADRFKINLTLEKRVITSSDDANFVELLRLKNGILQNQVRTTEYAILEDTFARRTFDESGDYAVRDFDLDLREHVIDGNNRGIYTVDEGGDETLMTAGLSPGKAYIQGYEISTIGTTFVNINKAREFATQNNFNTRIDLQNYVYVTNVYGTPDIGFVSGDIEAYRNINLYKEPTQVRGTQNTGTGGLSVNQIGRAKSRGFEYVTGASSNNIFASSSQTDAIFKHYLFDIEMFTHLKAVSTYTLFSIGEKVTGSISNATGYVHSSSTTEVLVLSNIDGTFSEGETVTGQTSSNTMTIDTIRSFDFSSTKQLGMSASPTYTADTSLNAIYGDNITLTGTITAGGGSTTIIGSGTFFETELKIGDQITFATDSGTNITRTVSVINSNTNLIVGATVSGTVAASSFIRQRTKLNFPNKNVALFELPYKKIKTLKTSANGGVTDTNYSFRRHFIATLSANGDATITAGTNETFTSLTESDYSISIMSKGAGTSGEVGDVLSITGNNHESDPIFNLGGSPSGKTLTLDFGANYQGHKIKILATISKSLGDSKSKTYNENSQLNVTSQDEIESGTISLRKADIFRLNAVYMSSNFTTDATTSDIDISNRFTLDNGQRDNFYDIGRIVLKSGELTPTGRLLIVFDYLSHGTGDYFSIDSYTGALDYEEILNYTSDTTGKTYDLRDCIDMRPRVDDASSLPGSTSGTDYEKSFDGTGSSTIDYIKFNSDMSNDFEYYLPRIDKIFVDKEGQFKISKGNASLVPQVPLDLAGAMHLYTIEIPAYTLSTEDVTITKVDNRRFTMRDIGKLQDRIENLEYYTQLSLLETQAQNLQIQDSEGFDRFKNGFIVDNFTGHNIGDVGNRGYKCSIDMAKGEMRPLFNEDAVSLIESNINGSIVTDATRTSANYQRTGDVITLPYVEETLVDQPFASKTINVNPFNIRNFAGSVELTPTTDEWKETERAPELLINNVGGFDTLVSNLGNEALEGFEMGTIWNEWQDTWTGTPTDIASRDTSGNIRNGRRLFRTTEVESIRAVSQTRTGIRQTIIPQTIRNSIGDRIVSVAFVPFIRSRVITFNATRLKPNTQVYPFFDNIDISEYVTSSGDLTPGGTLVTDENGSVTGTFEIPDPKVNSNPRWRAGTRVFRLTSSPTDGRTDVETSAESDYVARGILETVQNTIISTREPAIVRESTSESRSIARSSTRESTRTVGWVDPLAQTFLIDDQGGVFLTSIDIFFSSKDNNLPVTLQLREVVNGYPGNKILPFSEVTLNPSSVNLSQDSSTATTFTFSSPVYIQENIEYCFVLLSNSDQYRVYASRLGETVIGSNRTISQQPYAGVLFKSQNGSTWTADQNEDLKFKIKRAEYSDVTGTITLANDTVSTRTLKNNPIRTTNGSNIVRVFHKNHGMHGSQNNVTISGVIASGLNGISQSEINATHTSITNVTLDSYDITLTTPATATGDIGGDAITATQNRIFDVLNVNLSTLEIPGTQITSNIRTTSGRSIHGAETEFSLQSVSDAEAIVVNDNVYFTSPRMIASQINETNEMSGNKSFLLNVNLSTSNTKHSPILDLQRASAFVISNRLNNPTSGNTPNYVAETSPTGGSSAAAYITRPITLTNASTALDIRLTANVRSSSEIEVYYRTTSSEEVRDVQSLSWIPFNTDGSEDETVTPASNSDQFSEYKYTTEGINDFTAFQIKIIMKGTISSYPPIIRDMRGIALAI